MRESNLYHYYTVIANTKEEVAKTLMFLADGYWDFN